MWVEGKRAQDLLTAMVLENKLNSKILFLFPVSNSFKIEKLLWRCHNARKHGSVNKRTIVSKFDKHILHRNIKLSDIIKPYATLK